MKKLGGAGPEVAHGCINGFCVLQGCSLPDELCISIAGIEQFLQFVTILVELCEKPVSFRLAIRKFKSVQLEGTTFFGRE